MSTDDHTDLVDRYVRTFLGYGNLDAPLWFIGLEHGGGHEEMPRRLQAWDSRGRRPLEDLQAYHAAFGNIAWASGLQSTYKQLCRIAIVARGETDDEDSIRQHQTTQLGRSEGDTCLVEWNALPRRNNKVFNHATLAPLPYLQDRRTFERSITPNRLAVLRHLILKHRPAAVVGYGRQTHRNWATIAGCPIELRDGIGRALAGDTTIFVIRHPTSWSKTGDTTNEYFAAVGRQIGSSTAGRL